MLSKFLVKGNKSTQKDIEFDMFDTFSKGGQVKDVKNAVIAFNFDALDGRLQQGYGFKKFCSPQSETGEDEEVVFHGSQILTLWPLAYYENTHGRYIYYLIYFNELNQLGVTPLFAERPLPLFSSTQFETTPVGNRTNYKNRDALVFSAPDKQGVHILSGRISTFFPDVPSITSVCCHNSNLFAVTGGDKEKLVYSQNQEISEWKADSMQEIKFNDALGRINKVITFNDYVFVFRDFGINKISFYSTRETYDISTIYQSDSFINPTTIASSGERIFFLEGRGVCAFNGSSVSKIELGCEEIFQKADKTYANAVCFDKKYYLACRYDFDDGLSLGCENEEGYVNNCLFVVDLENKNTNIVRGVDINRLCVLNNPIKSKVVACFRGENVDKVGEITKEGKIFDKPLTKVWQSVKSDLGMPDKIKKTNYICIKSSAECDVTLQSEKMKKSYHLWPSEKIQRIAVSVVGKEFSLSIMSQQDNITISNVKLGVSIV